MLQVEVHGNELVLDLFNGLRTKVTDVEQVVLGELDQLTHGVDAGALQAVVGADGQVQILDLLIELGIGLLALRCENRRDFALFLLRDIGKAQERPHVLVDDVGRTAHRLVRGDGAVGLDLKNQLVVVGALADAGIADVRGCNGARGRTGCPHG